MKGWINVGLAVALVACSVAFWAMPSDRSRLVITVIDNRDFKRVEVVLFKLKVGSIEIGHGQTDSSRSGPEA